MAYTDYNGMVRPGDMAVSNNPTYNGASTWSPWAGDLPGSYEAGFEMRNYAPGGYRGQTGQALKPTTPAQISAPVQPLTPIAPLHFGSAGGGNTPAPASSGGGIGTYQTGIQSGLLSNDAIAAARARLQPTAPMPTANVPTNPAQQSQMAQQYQDLISQGTLISRHKWDSLSRRHWLERRRLAWGTWSDSTLRIRSTTPRTTRLTRPSVGFNRDYYFAYCKD
jgi:hypothetical protein